MSFLTSVVVGGLIGWLSRMLAAGRPRQNMFMSVVIGIAGALLSGWLISPMFGLVPAAQVSFSLMAVALAVIGAMVLLSAVDLARRLVAR